MKFFTFIKDNILYLITLALFAFIPLYPKLPLIDVRNTWAYVRLEDFVVLSTIIVWFILLLKNKISFKTPLTLPIILFWIIGGISTLHGVLILFPTLSNVFSNVAILSFIRRIEYMFLFFVAFSGMRDKKLLQYIPILLGIIVILASLYGFGQKFLGFPAFLTGNEEFAKGIPLRISTLGRVPSTFAGHYDLAAYLVLVVPIIVSAIFGFKKILLRIFFLISASLGFILMFMTVSRISFAVLLIALLIVIIIQKKKLAVISLILLISVFVILAPSLLSRFASTVGKVDVLVDTKTGQAIGHIKEVPASYFKNRIVFIQPISEVDKKNTTSSAVFPFEKIPPQSQLIVESNKPNGESLPQGSSYINLSLSPVIKTSHLYFFEKASDKEPEGQGEIRAVFGDFVIKNAKAYDISFTTRFQGEWPNTLAAFKRNIFLGSGYGSVSLAVDNDYLRILGESGLIGFLSFLIIFLISAIYIKKILPDIDSGPVKSFIIGFIAGSVGLFLNAIFIDVFEASKIAFSYWLIMGIVIGGLALYKKKEIDTVSEIKKILISPYAFIIYLITAGFILFAGAISYYFVGDDFTWLRWATDCINCNPLAIVSEYFTKANGFFYRPGTKLYFYLMQNLFWLNQTVYHFVSIVLHLLNIVLFFLISRKIFKNYYLSVISVLIFIFLSGYTEAIFWIAATGHLFNITFILLALLSFILWRENKKIFYFALSFVSIIISLLFHELGIIAPLLIIFYDLIFQEKIILKSLFSKLYYYILFFPVLPYLLLRLLSQSHWLSGDYNYNLLKLPFNFFGNILGYFILILFGSFSLNFYEGLRSLLRANIPFAFLSLVVLLLIFILFYRFLFRKLENNEKRILVFSILFFIVSLLPFLGLGNITSRYSYLASFGISLLLSFFLVKLFKFLYVKDRQITISIFALIAVFFLSIQLFQFQKTQTDWQRAGQKSKSFLSSLENAYVHYGVSEASTLYFVDVPIREGEAWIFPVGLEDATWLLFPGKNIKVNIVKSVDEAFAIMSEPNGRVFKFNEDGTLVEWIKNIHGEITPLNI
ncbi:MAG: O-antigen ligase family protein [Candidatus Levybacteria bacterium]|nr:O-antigen ligase family protein [Candidatus Levybacteria bacterium]